MKKGAKAAGEETFTPKKEHELFAEDGIYGKIRHPQALGEGILGFGTGFIFQSPFIALFSLLWIPLMVYVSFIEEKDLVKRFGDEYRAYQTRTGMFWPKRIKK